MWPPAGTEGPWQADPRPRTLPTTWLALEGFLPQTYSSLLCFRTVPDLSPPKACEVQEQQRGWGWGPHSQRPLEQNPGGGGGGLSLGRAGMGLQLLLAYLPSPSSPARLPAGVQAQVGVWCWQDTQSL